MLTADHLNASMRRYLVAVVFAVIPGMALLLLNRTITDWLVVSAWNRHTSTLSLALLVVSLVLVFSGIFLAQRRSLSRCPHCRKTIYPNAVGIVIATRHCTKCGGRVIAKES